VINEQQDSADGKQSEDPGINQGPGQALVKPKPGEICLRMDKYITAERRTNKTGRQSRLLRDQLTVTRRRKGSSRGKSPNLVGSGTGMSCIPRCSIIFSSKSVPSHPSCQTSKLGKHESDRKEYTCQHIRGDQIGKLLRMESKPRAVFSCQSSDVRVGHKRIDHFDWDRASAHQHLGAKAALQLLGQLMGASHGHGAELADGLAAAADVDGVALMAIGLDANCFAEAQGLRGRRASPGRGSRSVERC
jgi:hypothetical protein